MATAFFVQATVSEGRQRAFRWSVASHLALLAVCAWIVCRFPHVGDLITGCVLLTAGIAEGAMLLGWRLTQLPKSQALEFLLVSPMRPSGVFLAEAAVGLCRLALVTLSGLPVLTLFAVAGYIQYVDLVPFLVMPFTWGALTGLALTIWAYEPTLVRRWAERLLLLLTIVYLVVGVLAGEHLARWLGWLPGDLGQYFILSVHAFHRYNPFAVIGYWVTEDWWIAWQRLLGVEIAALLVVLALLARTSWRLRGHFHERHYMPAVLEQGRKRKSPGDHPLSWWAVKRVTQYSGRVNLWLAGGFGVLYALYIMAGASWPAWLGRSVFQLFDGAGGVPMLTTALVVLAAVPAAYQYGLWDSNAQDRCRRLELLLLTQLQGVDYWRAASIAAWRRGRGYFLIAGILWFAAAVSGKLTVTQALGGVAAGIILWGLYFALGFWAFSRGVQANKLGLGLTVGLPALTFFLAKTGWLAVGGLLPPGTVYYAAASDAANWLIGATLGALFMLGIARWALGRCEAELRDWYTSHHGTMVLE